MKIKTIIIILLTLFFLNSFESLVALGAFEKVDGLEYTIQKIIDPPLERQIARRFDLYEIYLENRSAMTFSIPGYSIDVGASYSSIDEVRAFFKDKSSKKMAVFNIAAGAASIALGGIAKTAANTAARSVGVFRRKKSSFDDDTNILSSKKIYILYPGDGISLFMLIDRFSGQVPNTLRFICHDEELNVNYVVINNKINLQEYNANEESKQSENVIANPVTDQYK